MIKIIYAENDQYHKWSWSVLPVEDKNSFINLIAPRQESFTQASLSLSWILTTGGNDDDEQQWEQNENILKWQLLPCCWSQRWSGTRSGPRRFSGRLSAATCRLPRPCRIGEQTWLWSWLSWSYYDNDGNDYHDHDANFDPPVISDDEWWPGGQRYGFVVSLGVCRI